jgi:hypothetical protein
MASTGANSTAGVFHDVVKGICAVWGEFIGYGVVMEALVYKDLLNRPFIPDVVMTLKKRGVKRKSQVFIEVQKENVHGQWYDDHVKIYEGKNWICIDLNKMDEIVSADYNTSYSKIVEKLYNAVTVQLDNETLLPPKPRPEARASQECVDCGRKFKNLRAHQARVQWKKNVGATC